MTTKAPTRASGKLTITFGLVTVPVQIYSALEEQGVERHMYSPEGNAIQFKRVDSVTGEEVPYGDIVMMTTTEAGELVSLSDEEIAEAMGEENGKCELLGFYPLPALETYCVTGHLQVRPQTVAVGKKKTHPYDKAFSLLMAGMKSASVFALLRYTLRGKPHLGALLSDGTLRLLAWADEVRESLPLPEAEVSTEETAYAVVLIDSMIKSEPPLVENGAAAKVRAFVEAKAKGETTPVEQVEAEPTLDLVAALKASIDALKVGATN